MRSRIPAGSACEGAGRHARAYSRHLRRHSRIERVRSRAVRLAAAARIPVVWSDSCLRARAANAAPGLASRSRETSCPAGRRCDPRRPLEACGRRCRRPPGARRHDAASRPRRGARRLPPHRARPAGSRTAIRSTRVSRRWSGTSSRRRGCSRASSRSSRRPGSARTGMWAFDTMTAIGAGNVGGGARGGRLRADRRRPRRRRRASPTPARARRGTTSPARLRRLVLPEQRGRRGAATPRQRRRAGRDRRHRRAPRQRRAGDLLGAGRRAHGLGARRPSRGLVPALPRRRGRDSAPEPARARTATCRLPRERATRAGSRRSATSRSWVEGVDALVVALGSTRPRATRTARCTSPTRAIARRAGGSARSGLPTVVVQEGGYDLATIGDLVRAFLEGVAQRRS